MANATRAVLGTVRRSAVLNTRHSVRSVPGRSVVVYEVARGFSGGQEFATSINVANEDSVTGVTELGVQPARGAGDRILRARGLDDQDEASMLPVTR